MIFDAASLPLPGRVKADLCVVGSGPGGAGVATLAAEAGLRVVVLEAGAFITPSDMTQREEEMLPQLLWSGGGRTSTNRAVHIHQGKGVGGSSLHNFNLCKRIPAPILEDWQSRRGLSHLPLATWSSLYDEVERLLGVTAIPEDRWNRHNRLLKDGCDALGWRGGGLTHNRDGCIGSGFCELGCSYDAKNNALKVLIPRAVGAGADVLTHCQAVRIHHHGGIATGVDAVALDPRTGEPLGAIQVDATAICLSASATATPAILLRSGIPDPGGETGKNLHIHPAAAVAAGFSEPINAWSGIPQTYECTEWLDFSPGSDRRCWIVPAFAHPMGSAAMLTGHGAQHREMMQEYDHIAVLSAMLHDLTRGTVSPDGDLDLKIDYWPDDGDRWQLARGLRACGEILFAAGAKWVSLPSEPVVRITTTKELHRIEQVDIRPSTLDLTAVHPMSSVPMGDDPQVAAVDSRGRHHHVGGLWIADGSLFPTSIGVPPQLSIYAMGLHVGRDLVRTAHRA